ncbi:MAG: peptidyl-prolyl cis-trans isomerase [Bdellovibrionaceae bacterium]|nr:peptidyl-prolyl cis-trans isomerase [Pseudobdellovibrionaceae bacterium]
MRHSIIKLSLIILLGVSLSSCKKKQDLFNENIISSSHKSLTGFEFSNLLVRKFIEQDIKYPKPDVVAVIKRQIVEDFIIQSTYEKFASENNIFVKKESLDEAFEKLVDSYPDRESFEIFLNEAGLKVSDVRSSIKDRLLRQLVREQIMKDFKTEITEDDLKNYYNQNKQDFHREKQLHLKQIVVEHEEEALKIQDLLKIGNNKNYESLAQKYSLAPEKIKGGDLGWVNVSDYPAFAEAEKTSNGRISSIIKSANGYHIFKVVNRRAAQDLPYNNVKTDIKRLLERQLQEQFVAQWLKERAAQLDIEINNDLLSKIVVNRPSSY